MQISQSSPNIYTVQVRENHQSPNMRAKYVDPSTSQRLLGLKQILLGNYYAPMTAVLPTTLLVRLTNVKNKDNTSCKNPAGPLHEVLFSSRC